MRRALSIVVMLWVAGTAAASAGSIDSGVIRLRSGSAGAEPPAAEPETPGVHVGAARQGFDYEGFQSRLESLWFQRKALLASGREQDGLEQLERIRSACAEEGVRRLDHVAGALVAEARRDIREGSYPRAVAALDVAAALDPDRPQVHLLLAAVRWKSDRAVLAAAGELLRALRATFVRSARELRLFHQVFFLVAVALAGGGVVFAGAMAVRHQAALRHQVEEWARRSVGRGFAYAAGWAALALPLLTWIGAGWSALYWIVVTFRFMSRRERLVAAALLAASAATLPAYRVGVALFGAAADPAVRTTLLSVGGEYDPDRVVRLRELVEAHPDDPVYRFLLAGLYKSGRYFEEAFAEYRHALQIDPALPAAYINIGNVFHATGQYGEAIVQYTKAIELAPDSLLAHFNMHLAQSEDFRFKDAEQTLAAARAIDADRVAALLAAEGSERPTVRDATLELTSIWGAALGGREVLPGRPPSERRAELGTLPLVDPIGLVSIAALVAAVAVMLRFLRSDPARPCIRCGAPFCSRCKREQKEGREYCTQCLHLFVRGEGIAPAAKTQKLDEIARYDRWTRRTRRALSALLPGAGQLLRGRPAVGLLLATLWIAAIVALRPELAWDLAGLLGLALEPELLTGVRGVPVSAEVSPLALAAAPALPLIWCAGNLGSKRRRER